MNVSVVSPANTWRTAPNFASMARASGRSPGNVPRLLDDALRRRLAELGEIDLDLVLSDLTTPEAATALKSAEVLLTCWGCPPLTEDVLRAAPNLRAVIHAAGSVKGLI